MTQTVSSGQTVSGAVVISDDTLTVLLGGTAISATVSGYSGYYGAHYGFEYVHDTDSGANIGSAGEQYVVSGGSAIGVTVASYGDQSVSAGGTANGTTINSRTAAWPCTQPNYHNFAGGNPANPQI